MKITLYRGYQRAIFVPRGTKLSELPPSVVEWLGPVSIVDAGELNASTPTLGLDVAEILGAISTKGFAAVDAPAVSTPSSRL